MIINGVRYLVTMDEPMVMKNGLSYDSLWGVLYVHEFKETFGFTARGHANYFYEVTDGSNKIIIAGCRVNHAVECPEPPTNPITNKVTGLNKDGKLLDVYYERIYFTEKT